MKYGVLPALAAVALGAGAAPAQAATSGSVGGVSDPAAGTLRLNVLATEDAGAGLRRATASIGGVASTPGEFDCSAACPSNGSVTVAVDTTSVPDGPQRLLVVVEDGAGAATTVVDRTIEVRNAVAPNTSTVVVDLGGPQSPAPTSPGSAPPTGPGTAPGAATPVCLSPRLTVALTNRPLRYEKRVPVLATRRDYRFSGTLTCLVGSKRVLAPKGVRIRIRNIIGGRTVMRPGVTVQTKGAFAARLRFLAGRRTVIFRMPVAAKVVQVRIPIKVVKVTRR